MPSQETCLKCAYDPHHQINVNTNYPASQRVLWLRRLGASKPVACSAPCYHVRVIYCIHITLFVMETGREQWGFEGDGGFCRFSGINEPWVRGTSLVRLHARYWRHFCPYHRVEVRENTRQTRKKNTYTINNIDNVFDRLKYVEQPFRPSIFM